MKKKKRGTHEHSFDSVNEIAIVRWNENSVVTVLSNHLKHEPMHRAKRFDQKKKWSSSICRIRYTSTIEQWAAWIYLTMQRTTIEYVVVARSGIGH